MGRGSHIRLIPYSSVIEGDKHAGIGIIQLSGYCGLCIRPSGERPVAIDPTVWTGRALQAEARV